MTGPSNSPGGPTAIGPGATRRAVALLSGGLDSVVSLAMADRELEVRLVLFCNYGQRSLTRERASVIDIVSYYGLPFKEIDITWLRDLLPAGMRESAADRPAADTSDELDSLDDVWIPNRNGVLLNVAAAYAESYRCGNVVTGFNREEAVEFPDNGPEYVDAVNRGFEFSTRGGVRVISYTLGLTKREILRKGVDLSAPLSALWSCYRGGERMCGNCASCRRLKAAIDSSSPDHRPVIEFEA